MDDPDPPPGGLSTAQVAAATGYCGQQIRNLEALGVLAPVARAGNGYRRFTAVHTRDLRAYRELAVAVGPVCARRVMRDVRVLPPDEAAARVCALHTVLERDRAEAVAARRALRIIRAEADADAPPAAGDALTVTELADALGVRTSTLRFWEKAGLFTPDRVATNAGSARRYPPAVVHEVRIVAALRSAGYGIGEVREASTAIRARRDVGAALAALDARLEVVTTRMIALLRAGAVLAEIVADRRSPAPPARVNSACEAFAAQPVDLRERERGE